MREARPAGLLKISELARAAGVSPTTVKYYVKAGLVEIACKTGPNMAYYHPDSVERVKLIKTLQSEKFYPLAVIKRLLKSGEIDLREVELLDAIHKTGRDELMERVSAAEARKLAGISRSELEALAEAEIVTPVSVEKKRCFSRSDCRIMALVRRRTDAGIPFSQTLHTLRQYSEHLRAAAEADVEGLIAEALLRHPVGTREIVRIIRTSDETLDEFITLKRYALNRALGSAQVSRMDRFTDALAHYLRALAELLQTDHPALARQCAEVFAAGPAPPGALLYRALLAQGGKSIAATLSAAHRAKAYFSAPPAEAQTPEGLLETALWLGWLSLAPAPLGGGETEAARALQTAADPALIGRICALLPPAGP